MFSFFIQTILVMTPNTGERALLQETHGSAATETASLQEKKHSGVLLKGGEKKIWTNFHPVLGRGAASDTSESYPSPPKKQRCGNI